MDFFFDVINDVVNVRELLVLIDLGMFSAYIFEKTSICIIDINEV